MVYFIFHDIDMILLCSNMRPVGSGFFSTQVFSCAVAGGGRTVAGEDTRITTSHRSTEHPAVLLRVVLTLFFFSCVRERLFTG